MKKINYIYIGITLLFASFLMTSCEKEIDVDLRSIEPKVVIEGWIAKDSIAKVNVTKTKDFNDNNDFPPVFGAIVTVSDDKGNSEILDQDKNGTYVSKLLRGKEDVTYYLNVKVEGNEYTSVSRMPKRIEIDSITMLYIPALKYAFPQVSFTDPKGKNYYRNILYLNRVRMDIGSEATDDKLRDGFPIHRTLPVFDDDKEDSREVEKGDTVLVELQSIDKGAYDFFETLGNMDAKENNPTTNIVGGALGYFSAYSMDRKQVIADW